MTALEPFYAISDTVLRMLRNKRRSTAMFLGVLFCTLIISSVSLFNDVLVVHLRNNEYEWIPYQVSIYPDSAVPASDVYNLSHDIKGDDRVSELMVMGGSSPLDQSGDMGGTAGGRSSMAAEDGWVQWGVSVAWDSPDNYTSDNSCFMEFLPGDFVRTDIYSKSFESGVQGTFDLNDGNSTVLPRGTAGSLGVGVGDVIPYMRVRVTEQMTGFTADSPALELRNVKVTAIVDWSSLMSYMMAREEVYLNIDTLFDYNNTLLPAMQEHGMFFISLRLDLSQFNTGEMSKFRAEVETMIKDIVRDAGFEVHGQYFLGFLAQSDNIFMSATLMFIFLILTLPVLALSIYLLVFGLELSLEDRKREIGILKAQGASPWQIFRMLMGESMILLVAGLTVGFLTSIMVAWVMISTTGFLQFEFSKYNLDVILNSDISGFIKAYVWSLIVVGVIVTLLVLRKGKSFIDMEVSEAVQRGEHKKPSLIRRAKIDIILFVIGMIAATFILINDLFLDTNSNFGTTQCLMVLAYFIGPFALWIGGAMVGPPLMTWLLTKGQGLVLRLPAFSDVALVLKSGLKRRTHVAGLAVLIILAMSVATMAATQSYTDERSFVREAEFKVGADLNVFVDSTSDETGSLLAIDGVEHATGLAQYYVTAAGEGQPLYGIDAKNAGFVRWHEDSFNGMSPEQALSKLSKPSSTPGVFIGEEFANINRISEGDMLELYFTGSYADTLSPGTVPTGKDGAPGKDGLPDIPAIKVNVTVLGTFDHIPPGITYGILCDQSVFRAVETIILGHLVTEVPAPTYFVDLKDGADREQVKRDIGGIKGSGAIMDLEEEGKVKDNFGISGLLTLMLALSLVGLVVGSFTFSSILMQRRMREFALLQTLGASRMQVYKVAVGENLLLLSLVILWGVLLGLLLSYVVNGFFTLIRLMFSANMLPRTVFIPWPAIILMAVLSLVGMILVMIISAMKAARQDLSVSTRVI